MRTIVRCKSEDYPSLVALWERSVRATHDFLDEAAIEEIKEAVIPSYFPNVEIFGLEEDGVIQGFIGVAGDKVEMLFVDSNYLRHGVGSALMEMAISKGARKVDVNEQNPAALAFYLKKGFEITGRDEKDASGRSYPI